MFFKSLDMTNKQGTLRQAEILPFRILPYFQKYYLKSELFKFHFKMFLLITSLIVCPNFLITAFMTDLLAEEVQ